MKKRTSRRAKPQICEKDLKRAEDALDQAKQERKDAEQRVRWRESLRERWDQVHERNNLSTLFTEDYGRTN